MSVPSRSMWALTWLSKDSWLLSSRRDSLVARAVADDAVPVSSPLVGTTYI
jgi:hypothetical protein